jgi:hypothetical protein
VEEDCQPPHLIGMHQCKVVSFGRISRDVEQTAATTVERIALLYSAKERIALYYYLYYAVSNAFG